MYIDTKLLTDAIGQFNLDISLERIFQMWDNTGRYHHTTQFHLYPLLEDIQNYEYFENDKDKLMLIVVALFHDIIYNKNGDKDVDDSIVFFRSCTKNPFLNEDQKRIVQIIENTKDHKPRGDKLSDVFNGLDCKVLNGTFTELLQYERNIRKEYKHIPVIHCNIRMFYKYPAVSVCTTMPVSVGK